MPSGNDLAALGPIRARYLAETFGESEADLTAAFSAKATTMRRLAPNVPVWLWFADTLPDQLQLLQVLHTLQQQQHDGRRVFLVEAPASMAVPEMGALAASKRNAAAAMEIGAKAWQLFTSEDPRAFAALSAEADRAALRAAALPHLGAAVEQWCELFPAQDSGLTSLDRAILTLLQANGQQAGNGSTGGPQPEEALHAAIMAQPAWRWLAPQAFAWHLRQLQPLIETAGGFWQLSPGNQQPGRPPQWPDRPYHRWHGGTLVTPARPWRWQSGPENQSGAVVLAPHVLR